ncbi:MAG: carboxypeptidase M32 [Isosphaeraceae bacterium]|nr:carboxypeptidase M32 [Isosphaeraceae bacterium]
MTTPIEAYDELVRRSRERALLESCSALLGWDEQTYMPRGASEYRGEQLALLAGLAHDRAVDPVVADLLAAAEGTELTADPLSVSAVNLREWRRSRDRAARLPRELVEEIAKTTTLAQGAWVEARSKSDFAAFLPWLERIIELMRRQASCLDFADPYDALLDEYEPGARGAELDRMFADLRAGLVPLVERVLGSTRRPDVAILRREFPVDRQRVFGEQIAAAVGFDFHRGRLDVTAHPFCTSLGPCDTRITTRFRPTSFPDAFFGILHEVGHGLYDQGLDRDQYGTPMGEAVSLGIHESQSRLWENAVGRSLAFWRYAFPLARATFPTTLGDVELEAFHFAINAVEPSLIRVEADEVTYNLHIMIRFELERALIRGDLAPAEVPGAWNEAYAKTLGVAPKNDAEGCLQDIHWSAGLIGYFPTYTLGNLFAAQLYEKADQDLGGLDRLFERGDFAPLLHWLERKIHRQGKRRYSTDLITQAVGREPSPAALMASLERKCSAYA